jgi:molybdenum cofactor cytidylyltransferase
MICDALILAAGGSARLGQPKQLLPYLGDTLLGCAIGRARAAPIRRVVVVLGAHAAAIREQIATPVEYVENPNWTEGIASSIRAGLAVLDAPDAVLLMVCDQPRVIPAHLRAIIHAAGTNPGTIAASGYSGVTGVPAVFPRRFFGELVALSGDAGARPVLVRHVSETIVVPCPEAALDVDTTADAVALLGAAPGGIL